MTYDFVEIYNHNNKGLTPIKSNNFILMGLIPYMAIMYFNINTYLKDIDGSPHLQWHSSCSIIYKWDSPWVCDDVRFNVLANVWFHFELKDTN